MIVSQTYNPKEDITTLINLPEGNIDIPGQWTKTKYYAVSRQHFFIDKDSTSIAVCKNLQEKYPFYKEHFTQIEFFENFYLWEKDHFEAQGFDIKEHSTGENYIIWTVTGNNVNTFFLYGGKEKFAYNYAVYSDNWTEEKKIAFLKKLFDMN